MGLPGPVLRRARRPADVRGRWGPLIRALRGARDGLRSRARGGMRP